MRPRNVDAIDATFVALLLSGFAHERRRSDEQIAVEGSQMNGAGRSIAKTPGDHSNRSGAMFARRFSEREWFGFERLQSNVPPRLRIGLPKIADFDHLCLTYFRLSSRVDGELGGA